MQSILDRNTPENIHDEPFLYLLATEAQDPKYHQELAALYPYMSGHPMIGRNNVPISMIGLPGFAEEMPIPHIGRYVKFSGEFKEPLYDIKPYQNEEPPRALTMGKFSPS